MTYERNVFNFSTNVRLHAGVECSCSEIVNGDGKFQIALEGFKSYLQVLIRTIRGWEGICIEEIERN